MTDAPLFSLLDDPVVRVRRSSGGTAEAMSLPCLLEALGRDEVRDFPALRSHQRAAWHSLLVQLAALALHGDSDAHAFDSLLPAQQWRERLIGLTSAAPNPAGAWCLVQPMDNPAFLQAADSSANRAGWEPVATPDALDMLVTSRNHDLKSARMRQAQPDDWLFALVSLQTQQGYSGRGNYGIARMNAGFASRALVGIAPADTPGSRWRRDVEVVLDARDEALERIPYAPQGGIALTWLVPWDGGQSLQIDRLDPLFIEICRRVRLVWQGSGLGAIATSSQAARIGAAAFKGNLADPWAPIDMQGNEPKSLTIDARGFDYRRLAEVLYDDGKYLRPACLRAYDTDPASGLQAVACAVARGEGRTEGYHERWVPIPPKAREAFLNRQTEAISDCAQERIEVIRVFKSELLRASLFLLFEGGPDKIKYDAESVKAQVEAYLARFEQAEDARFFEDLNIEIEAQNTTEARTQWMKALYGRAEAVLREAFDSGPQSHARRWRARSAALRMFHGGARKRYPQSFIAASSKAAAADSTTEHASS